MVVKTKKFQMSSNDYVRYAMSNIIREWWWAFLVPAVLLAMMFVVFSHWWWISALIVTILYLLFWGVQFLGVTQHPNFKMMFEKVNYEINSQQVVMKLNPKQGMPINWNMVQKGYAKKDAIVLVLSKAQLVILPHRVFNNANDIKFVESILRRKNFIK